MIDDIKEAVDQFTKNAEKSLTSRDLAGIAKIHFELDLLKAAHEARKPSKRSFKVELEDEASDD